MESIRTRTLRNVSFIGASQLTVLALTLVTLIVLSRILTPEDFGIVGIATVFLALFRIIQEFGITPAVIQRDTRVEDAISVGLTLRWMIAVISMILVICVSPLISSIYENSAITLVIIVMGLSLFIQPIAFPPTILLTRALNFSKLAIASIVQVLVYSCVAIGLSLTGFSYWSIVFGSLSGTIAYVAVLRHFESATFKPKIDKSLMKELLGFGSHLLVVGLMAFVIFNVDQLVVGKLLGVTVLGVYFVAVKFGRTLGEQISDTVNRVLFPTMARMKNSIDHIIVGQVQALRMIAIAVVPLSVGLSALSPLFVSVVLGAAWTSAIVPIAILSFQGLLNALISACANVILSIGKARYLSVQALVQAAALVTGIYPAAYYYGIEGVCILTTGLSFWVLTYFLVVSSRVLSSTVYSLISAALPSFLSGTVTYCVLTLFVLILPDDLTSLLALTLVGAAVYVASLHVASKGNDVRDFVRLVRDSLSSSKERNHK